jgi:hypothetical protein
MEKKVQIDKVNWRDLEVPLEKEETSRLLKQVVGWQQVAGSITKNFKFKDFKRCPIRKCCCRIAEKENHQRWLRLLVASAQNVQFGKNTG